VLGLLVASGTPDPSWFAPIVLGSLAVLFFVDHLVYRRTGRRVHHAYWGGPWYWRAPVLALGGVAFAYHAVVDHNNWLWLVSLVAWAGFVWMVVKRPMYYD
jgi:hypothetical protein